MTMSKDFTAKDRSSQSRVNTWRRENRMVILKGMPLNMPPEECEAACRVRLPQHQSLQFEWERPCNPWRKHRGRVALGFENAEVRTEAEQTLAGWHWDFHPILIQKVPKPRFRRVCGKSATETKSTTNNPSLLTENAPSNIIKSLSSAKTTKETATFRRPLSQAPPAAETIDLTAGSPAAPARPLTLRLSTPVNVPCAAATAVQEACCIAAEAAAAADAAVAEAHAATFRAFTAEAAGDIAAAASAQEQASAAEERARSVYGAAATAARIASAYSSCISPLDDFCRY
ncbi:hypothetical protein BBO_08713 [Beauveria brongniartii RCEF 3172]|uniref:RRM domain-containing protein n=1 Tax=Beauveria brongniartii RCEF 3172 TaxID=1081107 RepID=A0A166X6Z0_9HYPO|nr:hypothetical protein BBO_08713 [Beauveria brongniartii RCEF 3172]